MHTTKITLELNGLNKHEYVVVKQGDVDSRILNITLVDNGRVYLLTDNHSALLFLTKPDGEEIFEECTIENNSVFAKLTEQMLISAGEASIELLILNKETSAVLKSAIIDLIILPSKFYNSDIVSSSEYTLLLQKLQEADKYIIATEDINLDIKANSGTLKRKNQNFYPITDSSLVFHDKKTLYETLIEFKGLIEQGCTNEQLYAAIQSKIDDGSIANLSIPDNSITEEKLNETFLQNLKNLIKFKDNEGNEYTLFIDENGNVVTKKIEPKKEIINDGLVYNLEILDGKVIDTISGDECIVPYTIDKEKGLFTFSSMKALLTTIQPNNGFSFDIGIMAELNKDGLYPFNFSGRTGLNKINKDGIAYEGYGAGLFASNVQIKNYSNIAKLDINEYTIKDNDIIHYAGVLDGEKKYIYIMLKERTYTLTYSEETQEIQTGYVYIGWMKYLRIYNKPLTKEEIHNNFYYGLENGIFKSYKEEKRVAIEDGLTNLGSKYALLKDELDYIERIDTEKNQGEYTISDESKIEKSYTISDYAISEIDTTEFASFESLHFINKPLDNLKVNDLYKISALPYPYSPGDKFLVEYTSSDESICSCVQGLLSCKKAGNVKITAKLYGTEITTQCEITIEELETIEKVKCYIPANYINGINSFNGTPKQVAHALFGAIQESINVGYNYIVLPKIEYHIIPIDNPCLTLGDNITIDLNGSSIYLEEHEGTWNLSASGGSKGGYCLFSFIGESSKIINGNYFGERYNNTVHDESEYTGYGLFAKFMPGSKRCALESINFSNTVGMNINVVSNGGSYSEGTGKRGRIYYSDWEFGKLDKEGNNIEADGFLRTKDYIDLGFTNEFKYNRYIVGLKGIRTYQVSSDRWHTIYWYDENNNLLEIREHEHKFEEYELPEGAVKYKLYMHGTTIPTQNYGEDQCTLRCFMSKEPKFINIKYCKFLNNHAGAINYVGGQRCRLSHCYINSSGAKSGMRWAVDYEDGWMNMRGNIIDDCIIKGLVVQVSGNSNYYVNNYIDTLQLNEECELGNAINNVISHINISEKESAVNAYNIYKKITANSGLGIVNSFSNVNDTLFDF